MKFILSSCLLFMCIVNGEVSADIDNKEQSIYEDLRKQRLPYTFSQSEINVLPEGEEKTGVQELYDFMKLSFNVISNNKDELKIKFLSEDTDLDIINFCRKILSNPDNYKYIKEDHDRQYKATEKLLKSNNKKLIKYVNDIIHNNIYSVIFDILMDENQIDPNNFKYMQKDYIKDNVIPQICDKFKNQYRKEIINSLLVIYLFYKIPENISINNYKDYLMRTNGIHYDIWNGGTNHIVFSGLSFNAFMQIINSLDYNDRKAELENFRTLVQGGYLTNPYIVEYVNDH